MTMHNHPTDRSIMVDIYITREQAATLVLLIGRTNVGAQVSSTASDDSALRLVAVCGDTICHATILSDGVTDGWSS